jgi:hypothetical protein
VALDYLQSVIQDVHALVAHEPDPKLKAQYAGCLKVFLSAQQEKMQAQQQGGPGQAILQMLGGGQGQQQ